jgi:hypothetical protein
MAGIFPASWDGGIPPVASSPDNPPQALAPGDHTQPIDTSALYYGLGCDVRIRAPVLNSIISEIIGVLESAGIAYQAGRLNNLATAIAIIAQRGGQLAASVGLDIQQKEIGDLQKEVAALKRQVAALTNRVKVAA